MAWLFYIGSYILLLTRDGDPYFSQLWTTVNTPGTITGTVTLKNHIDRYLAPKLKRDIVPITHSSVLGRIPYFQRAILQFR